MSDLIRELSPERRAQLQGFRAYVRFRIPNELEGRDYQSYLQKLLVEYTLGLDPRNEREARILGMFHREWNREGGIGDIYVCGVYLLHCKLYLYDGAEDDGSPFGRHYSKGLLFRDHDETINDTAKVFDLADTFEQFLTQRQIPFERENQVR